MSRFGLVTTLAALSFLSVSSPGALATAGLPDSLGDTLDSDSGAKLAIDAGDINGTLVSLGADGIRFTVQVVKPVDPVKDRGWVDGASFVDWKVDTTGDGRADYVIEYYATAAGLEGDVSRAGAGDDAPSLCSLKAARFSVAEGYTAVVDPACIGNPATVAYQVSFLFDTDYRDDDAPQAEDRSPDTGLSPPVELGVPVVTPVPEATAPAVPAEAVPPPPADPPAAAPNATLPATRAPRAPAAAQSNAPARTVTVGAAPAPAPKVSPAAPGLARTGPREAALLAAVAGVVLMLAGFCFIGSAGRRRPIRA